MEQVSNPEVLFAQVFGLLRSNARPLRFLNDDDRSVIRHFLRHEFGRSQMIKADWGSGMDFSRLRLIEDNELLALAPKDVFSGSLIDQEPRRFFVLVEMFDLLAPELRLAQRWPGQAMPEVIPVPAPEIRHISAESAARGGR